MLVNMSISKIFIPNFVCVVQMKYTNISDMIFILSPGHTPGVKLWGAGGAQGVKKEWGVHLYLHYVLIIIPVDLIFHMTTFEF